MLFLSFSVALFGAFAIHWLRTMRWHLELIKTLTLVTLGCGILFGIVISLDSLTQSQPQPEMVQSWLALRRLPEGRVLSYEGYAHWLRYYSFKTLVTGPDAQELLLSNDVRLSLRRLQELQVRYLWINEDMKRGLVWHRPDEGLLFMLRNNQTFQKAYNHSGILIWTVTS